MISITDAAKQLEIKNETLYSWQRKGLIEIEYVSKNNRYLSDKTFERLLSEKLPKDHKKCTDCGVVDHKDNFTFRRNRCPQCEYEDKKAYRERNAERLKEKDNQKYERNKDNIKARFKEVYYNNVEKFRKKSIDNYYENKDDLNIGRLAKKYKITKEQYIELISSANGVCQLCGKKSDKLCIDHNHEDGVLRGVTCNNCNSALGFFNDDPSLLYKAHQYLLSNGYLTPHHIEYNI